MWAGCRDTVRARGCFVDSNSTSGKGFLGVEGKGEEQLLELRQRHSCEVSCFERSCDLA